MNRLHLYTQSDLTRSGIGGSWHNPSSLSKSASSILEALMDYECMKPLPRYSLGNWLLGHKSTAIKDGRSKTRTVTLHRDPDSLDQAGVCSRSLVVVVIGLVEKEVGGQLLVLVAGKVRLNDEVPFEAKSTELRGGQQECKQAFCKCTYPFDGIALLLRHAHSLSTRRQGRVLIGVLAEQLQELVRM